MNFERLGLKPPANRKKKKLGRGTGTGSGKTSGRGHKGQKSRSGSGTKPGFEGGQMPLIRRLPKRGFNNPSGTVYQVVNIQTLNKFDDNAEVNPKVLRKANIIKKVKEPVKILGVGELTKKLTVQAHAFSKAAREAIEKAGGEVKEL